MPLLPALLQATNRQHCSSSEMSSPCCHLIVWGHQRKGHDGLRRQWFRLVSIMLKASCNSNITTTQGPWQTCTTSQPCHAHRRHCLTQRLAKLKHYCNTGPAPLSDIVPSARNKGLLNLRKPGRIQTGTISMHKLAQNGPEPVATSSQLHRL